MSESDLFNLMRSLLDCYFGFLFCDDLYTAKCYLHLINNLNNEILDTKEDK